MYFAGLIACFFSIVAAQAQESKFLNFLALRFELLHARNALSAVCGPARADRYAQDRRIVIERLPWYPQLHS